MYRVTILVDRPSLCSRAGDVLNLHNLSDAGLISLRSEELKGLIKVEELPDPEELPRSERGRFGF